MDDKKQNKDAFSRALTIRSYAQIIDDWIRSKGVRYFDICTNVVILAEETGEVARFVAREWGEQSWGTGKCPERLPDESDEQFRKRVLGDELADVIWVATCIANQVGIDLEEAIRQNFRKKDLRDSSRHVHNPKLMK